MRKILAALALLLLAAPAAWAKSVALEWTPIKGAVSYEVAFQGASGRAVTKEAGEPRWKGELTPGIYAYRVRAIDRVKRPGDWSADHPLVVMPPGPAGAEPRDGARLTYYNPRIPTGIRWNAVAGVRRYKVEITRDGKPVREEMVAGTELALGALPAGSYEWKVRPVLEPGGRALASLRGRKWEGEPGAPSKFLVEQLRLDRPVPVHPRKAIPPPDDRRVKFRWDRVDGAEKYEVRVVRVKPGTPARFIAAQLALAKAFVTEDNVILLGVGGEGEYRWQVRALANADPVTRAPRAQGPASVNQLSLDPKAVFADGTGYFAFSSMLSSYTYQVTSQEFSFGGRAASFASTWRGSGEYYPKMRLGFGAAAELTQFTFSGQNFYRWSYEANLKYRLSFSRDRYGWFLASRLGLEGRQYFELLPRTATALQTARATMTLGPAIGLDFRKQLSESWSLGARLTYFLPLSAGSGWGDGSTLTGDASHRNASIGIQALYWAGERWGIGMGGFYDQRSISIQTGSGRVEQVFTDALYGYGSVVFSFGR